MDPQIFPIPTSFPGQLYIMPKPSGPDLNATFGFYKSKDVDLVVGMLEAKEMAELSLSNEAQLCANNGMAFIHHPIRDRGLPEPKAFLALIADVTARLEQGQSVVAHCWGGIGRSGMLVTSVLAQTRDSAETAVAEVSAARGHQVPDTAEQFEFVKSIVEMLKAKTA